MLKLTWINCFLLLIPILIWNGLFSSKLTQEGFHSDHKVSNLLLRLEDITRLLAFGMPIFLPLQLNGQLQKIGLAIFIIGNVIYFASWISLLYYPNSSWSQSVVGILSPHITPLILLLAIALISNCVIYGIASMVFITIHVIHGIKSFELFEDIS